ncbi:MAG: hypothetical protein PHN69_08405 [Candidatus Pacebacteria bacterium]|nr:hypothetical protein [Candidatus Paceibacterota bacterium]
MKTLKTVIICSIIVSSCFSLYGCTSTHSSSSNDISSTNTYSNYVDSDIDSISSSDTDSSSSQIDSASDDSQTQDNNLSSDNITSDNTISQNDATTDSETVEDNEKGACWALAEDVVKSNLKSPSTAKFPFSYGDEGVSFSKTNGIYTVTGWVDAENSYGAKLRNNFTVTMTKSGSGDDAKFTSKSCNVN